MRLLLLLLALVRTSRGDEDLIEEYVRYNRARRQVVDDGDIEWTHAEKLDRDGLVVVRWQPRHQEILFRVEARTLGYVGVGFSPNGGMEGADIVMGWVDDATGRAHLLDCHGVPKSQGSAPVRDEADNYTLMRGVQNGTHTVLEFRRGLDTCDTNDYILGSDTVRMIWAIHDVDLHNNFDMVYHGEKRGSQSVHLLSPPPMTKHDNTEYIRNWDVTLNNVEVMEGIDTVYWCKIFKAPPLQKKHHIIGYEPIIGPNHTNHVHHMLLHECTLDLDDLSSWEVYSREEGKTCFSPEMPPEWSKCLTISIAWAVGSKGETFPTHMGLPLAEKRNTFYMLEVHFDNPSLKRAVDTTGLRLFYTHKLRDFDGGILMTGVALSSLHVVPPKQTEYRSSGYCSFDCTKEMIPKQGINVVSVLLHSHLAGRRLKLRHVRGDRELTPIAQDDHYDFNYQQSRRLSHEVNILPGDSLITECAYSTKNRNKPTLGGYSTSEEMCLAFVLHYPKTELAGCYSMPPIKYFFETLGAKEFYHKSMSDIEKILLEGEPEDVDTDDAPESNSLLDRLIIKEPLEFQNKSFMSHLENIPYNETLVTQKIEEYFYKGLHLTFCRKNDDTLAIKEKVEKFPNFLPYTRNSSIQCSYRLRQAESDSTTNRINILFILLSLMSLFVF